MKLWKFVLLGVTGHLAKTKVLPALAEFAYTYRKEVDIEFIGWSRSPADQDLVKSLLEWQGQPTIEKISFIQESYDSIPTTGALIEALGDQEQLVVYSAIPPVVFKDLTASFCPYPNANTHLLMEKPFGEDYQQAQEILTKIENCGIQKHIHFLDHYAFKSSLRLSTAEMQNFDFLKEKKITSIQVKASEEAGVGTRLGYYNKIGAIKDMTNHLLVELEYVLNIHDVHVPKHWPITWSDLDRSQYLKYKKELGHESDTETQFKLVGDYDDGAVEFEVTLSSGKKQSAKIGQTRVNYSDGSYSLLSLSPDQSFTYTGDEEVSLNTEKGPKHDHVRVFHDILTGSYDSFRTPEQVLRDWEIYEQAARLKKPLIND